jgi:hypothetical protein
MSFISPLAVNRNCRRRFFLLRTVGCVASGSLPLTVVAQASAAGSKDIRGPAIVEHKGSLQAVNITSIIDGEVRGVSGNKRLEFYRGSVKKLWLEERESLPGISDPLRKKFTYDRSSRKFIPRDQEPNFECSRWDFEQDHDVITEITKRRILVAGVLIEKEEPRTFIVYDGEATATATVRNLTSDPKTLSLTLEINAGMGHANASASLPPLGETVVSVTFPTSKKEINSVVLADYEIS